MAVIPNKCNDNGLDINNIQVAIGQGIIQGINQVLPTVVEGVATRLGK